MLGEHLGLQCDSTMCENQPARHSKLSSFFFFVVHEYDSRCCDYREQWNHFMGMTRTHGRLWQERTINMIEISVNPILCKDGKPFILLKLTKVSWCRNRSAIKSHFVVTRRHAGRQLQKQRSMTVITIAFFSNTHHPSQTAIWTIPIRRRGKLTVRAN